jgi:hypothetical protein
MTTRFYVCVNNSKMNEDQFLNLNMQLELRQNLTSVVLKNATIPGNIEQNLFVINERNACPNGISVYFEKNQQNHKSTNLFSIGKHISLVNLLFYIALIVSNDRTLHLLVLRLIVSISAFLLFFSRRVDQNQSSLLYLRANNP